MMNLSLIVPTRAVASQTLTTLLGGQSTRIAIYQKSPGLFCDVFVHDVPIITGVLCLDRTLIVRDPYLGFIGDLAFFDLQGTADPDRTGLGTNGRFRLGYLTA